MSLLTRPLVIGMENTRPEAVVKRCGSFGLPKMDAAADMVSLPPGCPGSSIVRTVVDADWSGGFAVVPPSGAAGCVAGEHASATSAKRIQTVTKRLFINLKLPPIY